LGLLEQVRLLPAAGMLGRFPHELSGGQRQRLSIARAIAMDPVFIVADEPLSGADVSIRGKILNLFLDIQEQRNVAYLFITHDISIARAFAHRILVMYRGRIVEQGLAEEVIDNPQDPYTQRLVAAALAGRKAINDIVGIDRT
jgi:ABC-type oligopeptide transport system ATPase subunit